MQIAMQPTPSNATISIIHKPVSSPLRLLRRPIPQPSPRTIQSTPSSLKRSNTPLKLITPLGSKHHCSGGDPLETVLALLFVWVVHFCVGGVGVEDNGGFGRAVD